MFEMMVTTNKLAKELVNQELLIFCKYQVMQKISNALWSGGGNIKLCSQLLTFN
jgi:hypothetical protein